MKVGILLMVLILVAVLPSLVAADAITDDIHVQVQTTDSVGNIEAGTYNFTFNISSTSACDSVLYTNTSRLNTDVRGIISYYLPDVTLAYDQQYWLCYYRDGVLQNTAKIARVPLAFVAKNISCSGCINSTMLDTGYVDEAGDTMTGNLTVNANLSVNNNLFIGNVRLSNLSDNGLWNGSLNIYPDNETNNQLLLTVYGTGQGGTKIPYFFVKGSKAGHASGIVRSFMIVNENATLQNSTDLTSCQANMDSVGEELKIDCNTSTTGPDFLVGDDMQVIGDVWLKDSAGNWHFISRELDLSNEMGRNITLSGINGTLTGTNLTIQTLSGENIVVNINAIETILATSTDTIDLTNGTNTTPTLNQVYYDNSANPTLTKRSTFSEGVANIGTFILGNDGYVYGSAIGASTTNNFISGIYNRFFDEGSIYKSGFDINASSEELNISTGIMKVLLSNFDIDQNHSTSVFFIHIHNDGTFHQHTDLDDCDVYSSGESISNNKYFNLVCGIVITHDNDGRMYCTVQNKPDSEHTKAIDAELDQDFVLFFPPHDIIKKAYVPVARVVVKRSGADNTIQTLSNGNLFLDLRGTIQGIAGASPVPGVTSHSDLTNLDFPSAGHTGNLNMSGDNITGVSHINPMTGDTVTINPYATGDAMNDEFDLVLGNWTAGGLRLGNAEITSGGNMTVGSADFNGTFLILLNGTVTSDFELVFGRIGETIRLAIPRPAADLAMQTVRSVMVGGDDADAFNDNIVNCTAQGYHLIDCATDITGADLGVKDDLEIRGTAFINETLTADDINVTTGNLTLWDGVSLVIGNGSDFSIRSNETVAVAKGTLVVDNTGSIGFEGEFDSFAGSEDPAKLLFLNYDGEPRGQNWVKRSEQAEPGTEWWYWFYNGDNIMEFESIDGGPFTFIFNSGLEDHDFRVAGDSDANLIIANAGLNRIGMGNSNPAEKLEINGNFTFSEVTPYGSPISLYPQPHPNGDGNTLNITAGEASSFTTGTRIATNGSYILIEELEIEDIILAYEVNDETGLIPGGKFKTAEVQEIYTRNVSSYYVINDVETTAEHPFMTKVGTMKAQNLQVGNELYRTDGTWEVITSIDVIIENVTVYNIKVDDPHTYFADNYLVHNKIAASGGALSLRGGDGGVLVGDVHIDAGGGAGIGGEILIATIAGNVTIGSDVTVLGDVNATKHVNAPIYFSCGENAALDNNTAEWSCGGNGETTQYTYLWDSVIATGMALDCNTGTGTAVVRLDTLAGGDTGCNLTSTGTNDATNYSCSIPAGNWFRPFTVTDTGHANCLLTMRFAVA